MNRIAIFLSASTLVLAVMAAGPARGAEINWHRDIDAALAKAAKEDKLVFMDIYADWCGPCRMMDQQTFADARVQARLEHFVAVKVDADADMESAARFGTGSLPTLVAILPDGSPVLTTPGFHPPEAFLAWLDEADEKVAAFRELERRWKASPEDLETAVMLGRQYLMMNRADDGLAVLREIQVKALANPDAAARAQFQYLLGLTLLSADEFDAGISVFEQFGEDFPDDQRGETARRLLEEGRFLAATAALEAENYEEARTRYAAVIENDAFPDIVAEAGRRLESLELLGHDAPALAVAEWIEGEPAMLDGLAGKVVLLDFFQIICPGCQRAKPQIEALHEEYKDQGLEVIGVAVAFENEDHQKAEAIKAYVEKTGYAWPVAIDEGMTETFTRYQAMGSPWTVLIDRSGKVRHASFYRDEEVSRRVADLLKEAV